MRNSIGTERTRHPLAPSKRTECGTGAREGTHVVDDSRCIMPQPRGPLRSNRQQREISKREEHLERLFEIHRKKEDRVDQAEAANLDKVRLAAIQSEAQQALSQLMEEIKRWEI